ncbi:MAG: hypothetical protein AB1401_04990 [Thermodesulfobacteriota bacterium]
MKNTTTCRHCEKEVAVSAEKCPHCGGETPGFTKQQAETAKSITTILTIALLVLIIMWARSCWKAGDELENAGRDMMKAAEEMKKTIGKIGGYRDQVLILDIANYSTLMI